MSSTEIALVTGAGSGIGAAVAAALAERGASLLLVDYNEEGLESTQKTIIDKGGQCVGTVVDVRDDEGVGNAVQRAMEAYGHLDTVVACAGVAVLGDVTTLHPTEWERAIGINLTGIFNLARHTIPVMIDNGGGTFTAIASDAGLQGAQGYAAYCASKHGVIGLIRCLALDHGPQGVRSNVVCPAMVETPMADGIFEQVGGREFYASSVPLGRFAKPEEVADAVAHLSSAGASYVNGHTYVIDGGATAGYYEGQS